MKSEAAAKRHAIYGHVIHAYYPLSTLRPCDTPEGPLGTIILRAGEVPSQLPDPALTKPHVEVSPAAVLLRPRSAGSDLGRILIREGKEIVVSAEKGAERALEPFILGSGLGAICLQNGLLPLHASAVRLGQKAVAFAGSSGAGKSTMAAALAAQGHVHITDDISVIGFQPNGEAAVYPGTHMMKLGSDSSTALGLKTDRNQAPIGPRGKRLYGSRSAVEAGGPTKLAAVYMLELAGEADIVIEPLAGAKAIAALTSQIYRRPWLSPMRLAEARLQDVVRLALQIPCFRLKRPHRFDQLPKVLEAVARHRETLP